MKLPLSICLFLAIFAISLGGYVLWLSTITYLSDVYLKTAEQKYKDGHFDQALAATNKALKLTPKNAFAYYKQAVVNYYYAHSGDKTGIRDEAIAAIKKAISINPNRGDFYYTLGTILTSFNQVTEAEYAFKSALSIQHDQMSYRLGLARLYLIDKRWEKGFQLYNETLLLTPKNRLREEASKHILSLSNHFSDNEAIEFHQRALSLPLSHKTAQLMFKKLIIAVEVLTKETNLPKQFNSYEQAIRFGPHFPSIRHNLFTKMLSISHQWRESQDYAESADAYKKVLTLLPNEGGSLSEQRYRLDALFYLGISQKRSNLFDKATQTFESILYITPSEGGKDFEQNYRKAALSQLTILLNE